MRKLLTGLAHRARGLVRPVVVVVLIGLFTGGFSYLLNGPPGGGSIQETQVITLSGEVVALDRRDGRPLVLNLWASWCGPCRVEMPMMQEVAASLEDVDIVFANQGETAQVIAFYLATEGLTSRGVVLDEDKQLSRGYGAAGLPATLFFTAQGELSALHVGEISRDELMRRIDAIRPPSD
ncbi:TlpA family protein disulfide reductase [Pseudooceanicola batsensis]|uniref:TlpA family protein disulfide reductase n=1 Tax=Pseudooceanicola batsensis TaxID=314255 RepID=UPI000311A2D1|nr:TlpA disulfide reductase family protein [Pseudooceanicola batsensis]